VLQIGVWTYSPLVFSVPEPPLVYSFGRLTLKSSAEYLEIPQTIRYRTAGHDLENARFNGRVQMKEKPSEIRFRSPISENRRA
jgi:hypothetical protein